MICWYAERKAVIADNGARRFLTFTVVSAAKLHRCSNLVLNGSHSTLSNSDLLVYLA